VTEVLNIANNSEVRMIAELGAQAAEPTEVEYDQIFLVPDGQGGTIVQRTPAKPMHDDRARSSRILTNEVAFIEYVNRHGDVQTEVWADAKNNRVIGMIDGHASNAHADERFGWETHRATLVLEHTSAWSEWVNGQQIKDQVAFAEFIEDHAPDIAAPPAGELLEIAQTLHGTNKAEFVSGQRLSTGETQFKYVEDVQGKAGKSGDLTIPDEFTVALQPYIGGSKYAVTAKLRWRINGGAVSIFYKLLNLERVLEVAFEEIVEKITAGVEYPVFHGRP